MKQLDRYPATGQAVATVGVGVCLYDIEQPTGEALETLDALAAGRRVVRVGPTVYVLSLVGAPPRTSPLRA